MVGKSPRTSDITETFSKQTWLEEQPKNGCTFEKQSVKLLANASIGYAKITKPS